MAGVEINTSLSLVVSEAGLLAAGVWVVWWASKKKWNKNTQTKYSVWSQQEHVAPQLMVHFLFLYL